jgi:hypothetical protein
MRSLRFAVVLVAGVASCSSSLHGQNTPQGSSQAVPKPSPYTGVSQPPPDDTITVDEAAPQPGTAKLVARPADAPVVSAPVASVVGRPPSAQASCNPDDGIVGDPNPCAGLVVAPLGMQVAGDTDAGIVTMVPIRPGELPEGTILRMTLNEDISSGASHAGSDFSGKIAADVLSSGRVVIPQGSEVLGKIVRVTEGHRFGSPATVRVRPDVVVLPDGSRYIVRAQLIATSSKARLDSEGTLKPASQVKKNMIQEGAGIGTGAVAGALIGGGPGALVGSLVGAGVMTTHILVQHPTDVRVPKNTVLTLSLTQPMSITPEVASN